MDEIKVVDNGALGVLKRIAQAGHNMSPLARAIATEFGSQIEANFAAQGRPAWLGLAPSTIRQRTKQGKWPGMIMQVSGQLAASYVNGYDSHSAWAGSNKVYAAIQNFGGEIQKAAQSRLVRHRTDAKGNLLRSEHLKGKGLIFAKDSHKRAKARWFEQGAHIIYIPARPVLPIDLQGNLQPQAEQAILGLGNAYLTSIISGQSPSF